MPSPPASFLPPAAKKTNVIAVASLVTGILSCVPGMSVFAVILGIVGLERSGKPNVGGKGMAIAGLILGIIGLAWTIGFVLVALKGRQMIAAGAPARAVARQFTVDVGRGDADAAMRDCSPSISADKVRSTVTQAQAWGALQDTTFVSLGLNDQNGLKTATVGGIALFANAKKTFTANLDLEDGVYRITDFTFTDQK
jgi:hypothetical protein